MKENIQKRIGIIGGGQLGKMMLLEAKKMGISTVILDPAAHCPAHSLADEHITASFDDKAAIRRLAEKTDVLTYEFEHIDAGMLQQLEQEGFAVFPTAKSLLVIQNKITQKEQLQTHGIPVPAFMPLSGGFPAVLQAAEQYGYPFLLKAATGGYDGKGNYVVTRKEECETAFYALGGGAHPLMAERFFPFTMEISVLACRGQDGTVVVYPVAENIHHKNILFETRVPAAISDATAQKAMELSRRVMEVFQGVGMFCVEMFVDKEGAVCVNEVAPRPHNSGHYTIEACVTSQFEQHVRAVCGLPLGDADLLRPVCMHNLLGETGYTGMAAVIGADTCLSVPGAVLHIYGKEKTTPMRKMGHITVTAPTLPLAVSLAAKAKNAVKVIGSEKIN